MSPNGRQKLALPICGKAKVNFRNPLLFAATCFLCVFCPLTAAREIPKGDDLKIQTTTPSYDVDYYENVVEGGFGVDIVEKGKEKIVIAEDLKIANDLVGKMSEIFSVNKRNIGGADRDVRTYCSDFESKCLCSPDGTNLTCKGAGFVEVPSNLPSTLRNM